MFQNNSYIYHFDFSTLTEQELNQTFAIVYGMSREHYRDGCYHTEFMHLCCNKDGNGWDNTRLCRNALKNKGIYSGDHYGTKIKIVVKKLCDLIPIIKGTEKLKGIFTPDNFWTLSVKYFAD